MTIFTNLSDERVFTEQDTINTLTKYPSILVAHEMDNRGRFLPELTEDAHMLNDSEQLFMSEKLDGTNVRIVCVKKTASVFIGSREEILWCDEDICHNPAMNIVHAMGTFKSEIDRLLIYVTKLLKPTTDKDSIFVIYGELFGGRISKRSKQYTPDGSKVGFGVFDIGFYDIINRDIMTAPLENVSQYRKDNMKFLTVSELVDLKWKSDLIVDFHQIEPNTLKFGEIYNESDFLTNTGVYSKIGEETAEKEGIVVRTNDRRAVVKMRFEDYRRSLN